MNGGEWGQNLSDRLADIASTRLVTESKTEGGLHIVQISYYVLVYVDGLLDDAAQSGRCENICPKDNFAIRILHSFTLQQVFKTVVCIHTIKTISMYLHTLINANDRDSPLSLLSYIIHILPHYTYLYAYLMPILTSTHYDQTSSSDRNAQSLHEQSGSPSVSLLILSPCHLPPSSLASLALLLIYRDSLSQRLVVRVPG